MSTTSQGLYTPEAVRLDLPVAGVGSRTLAILIDLMVMLTLLYVVLIVAVLALGFALAGGGTEGPGWPAIVAALLLNFLVLWGYPTGCETVFGGRTAGKAALGLRVVTLEGAPVRFRHAAVRGLFAFVDFYLFLGIPALVAALVTRRGQRLGDLAAGTVTIRDRARGTAADLPIRWQVPPTLVAYAQTLDVRGLGPMEYALVRRFLVRSGQLRPEDRTRVARDLANAVAGRMAHRPPAGIHPEALLLCVAALMQDQTTSPRSAAAGPAPHYAPTPEQPTLAPPPTVPTPLPQPGPGGFAQPS